MSVYGIGSSWNSNQVGTPYHMTNSQFQQLGQDLATGNLSSAQSDFAILQQAFANSALGGSTPSSATSPSSAASAASTSNPVAQEMRQLGNDLKSGNLSGAQKDYSTIQQDMQNQFSGHWHHGHHMRGGHGPEIPESNQSGQDISSMLTQSSGTAAQQAYAMFAPQLQSYGNGSANAIAGMMTNPVSLVA